MRRRLAGIYLGGTFIYLVLNLLLLVWNINHFLHDVGRSLPLVYFMGSPETVRSFFSPFLSSVAGKVGIVMASLGVLSACGALLRPQNKLLIHVSYFSLGGYALLGLFLTAFAGATCCEPLKLYF